MIRPAVKAQLHPRNRFRTGYDFPQLIACSPPLAAFVAPNAYGDASVDYANPEAVKALNQALLKHAYDIETWDVPPGYLCPPIPGRSDYLHYLADLPGIGAAARPRHQPVVVLDIGTGASCTRSSARVVRLALRRHRSRSVALRWAKNSWRPARRWPI